MADKQVTVAEPEERVLESYAWFTAFWRRTGNAVALRRTR
jgi:hypothetical protein